MKKILFPFLLVVTFSFAQCPESLHNFTVIKINGDTLPLSSLAGKKVMVVNTASYCGYTPQYSQLEQLYLTYGGPTFEIIGFPCNDFGSQEPGSDAAIDSFCINNYNITFPMMHKISITAPDTAEVYKWLQLQSRNCVANAPVSWNFNKFLIDEAGNWIAHYNSPVSPLDQNIIDWILSPNTTGVTNVSSEMGVSVYPNPIRDIISLHTEINQPMQAEIKLLSIEGTLAAEIFSGTVTGNSDIDFPAANMKSGIYFLSVKLGDVLKAYKVAVLK